MANIIDEFELAGLREDFENLLGQFEIGGDPEDLSQAKTLGTIRRVISLGTVDPVTGKYPDPDLEVIFNGPLHFSPVTFRRDRQEIAGQEAIRIRQYRAVLPWDSGDIHLDDVLTIDATEDPELVGRSFDVTDVLYESELAARRISLTDTSKDIDFANCA